MPVGNAARRPPIPLRHEQPRAAPSRADPDLGRPLESRWTHQKFTWGLQFAGLRCQDISLDLRSGTADSWVLFSVDNTQLVGMAADLARLIRGRNVTVYIDTLKIVAREAPDINA